MSKPAVLELVSLRKDFPGGQGLFRPANPLTAVADVSMKIAPGEIYGLVGESGCGKSTLARCALGLIEPSGGQVLIEGNDPADLDTERLRRLRRRIQVVFQDPASSLNPRARLWDAVTEGLAIFNLAGRGARRLRAAELLERVGLSPELAERFPHELSGGQMQRACIARALALDPALIVADEPVSALDVSVQARILSLLRELRDSEQLALLLVSHDLAVVRQICDRVGVMYLGRIIEEGPVEVVFGNPRHPYTRALLAAVPTLRPGGKKNTPLAGEAPDPRNHPEGCGFHPRCPVAVTACGKVEPPQIVLPHDHRVTCILQETSTGRASKETG